MKRKRFKAEQIVVMLREAEIQMSKGLDVAQVCRNLGISEQTYYRWRKEYGGMKLDQAKGIRGQVLTFNLSISNISLKS